MELLTFLPATFLGFTIFKYTCDPKHALAKHRPHIQLWRFELQPYVRIRVKGRFIHSHHWINLSIFLTISLLMNVGFLDIPFIKGIIVGGIVQGLTFSDFKKIIYRPPDYTNKTSISSTTGVVKETS